MFVIFLFFALTFLFFIHHSNTCTQRGQKNTKGGEERGTESLGKENEEWYIVLYLLKSWNGIYFIPHQFLRSFSRALTPLYFGCDVYNNPPPCPYSWPLFIYRCDWVRCTLIHFVLHVTVTIYSCECLQFCCINLHSLLLVTRDCCYS